MNKTAEVNKGEKNVKKESSFQTKRPTVKKREHSLVVKRGEVFLADMGDVKGSEQGGKRPVVIIQNDVGNKFSTTVIVACITSSMEKAKLPTHVEVGLKEGLAKPSIVLLEQVRTIDKERLDEKLTVFSSVVMKKIDQALLSSLGF